MQSQADRLEDQRSELGGRSTMRINEDIVSDLVHKMQIGRIEEQRAMFGNNNHGKKLNQSDTFSEKNSNKNSSTIIQEESIHENGNKNESNLSIVSA